MSTSGIKANLDLAIVQTGQTMLRLWIVYWKGMGSSPSTTKLSLLGLWTSLLTCSFLGVLYHDCPCSLTPTSKAGINKKIISVMYL